MIRLLGVLAFVTGCAAAACSSPPAPPKGAGLDSLVFRGASAYAEAEYSMARGLWRSALPLATSTGDSAREARLLTSIGLAAWRLGDYAEARSVGEQALALKFKAGLKADLFKSYNALGLLASDEGRLDDALALYQSAADAARASRPLVIVARTPSYPRPLDTGIAASTFVLAAFTPGVDRPFPGGAFLLTRLCLAGILGLGVAFGCADEGKVAGPHADVPTPLPAITSVSAMTGGSYSLLAKIPVSRPQDIAVNPATNRIYVISYDFANPDPSLTGRLSVIDGSTNQVVTNIPVGQSPTAVQVDPVLNRVYVSSYVGELVVIDGATNTIIQRATAQPNFRFIGLDNTRNRIYGVRDAIEALDVFRASDGGAIGSIPVPVRAGPLAVNTRTDRVYVVSGASWLDDLVVVDPSAATIVEHLHIGFLLSIAVNQATNRVYAGSLRYTGTGYESEIHVVDGATNRVTARIPVNVYPVDLAVDEVADRIYAVEIDAGTLAVIDGASNTLLTRLPLVRWARHAGVNSQTHAIYAADDFGSLIWVYGWQPAPSGLEAVAALVESLIQSGTLGPNDGAGLMAKLDAVASLVSAGKTTSARALLNAFINQVNALVVSGRLTEAQAQPLIAAAQQEIVELEG